MEENFLLLFRFDNPLDSSVEFMKVIHSFSLLRHTQHALLGILLLIISFFLIVKIWREYDSDGSGYIEADELKVWKIIIFFF